MTIKVKLKDNSFHSNLRVNDILVTKCGTHYIVEQNQQAGSPYKIYNLITRDIKRNLQTLEKQVTRNGHVLGIGYLQKIINGNDFEVTITLSIEPKDPSF